ncbi:MAG: hypothetical protein BAJALOKI1v1_70028 [Promethearchaeota archaeon]|nr:MAG: hypothetical protein BAJALOKI1v1_70028 [Candidatus Lokiarchaeota archaeon]
MKTHGERFELSGGMHTTSRIATDRTRPAYATHAKLNALDRDFDVIRV